MGMERRGEEDEEDEEEDESGRAAAASKPTFTLRNWWKMQIAEEGISNFAQTLEYRHTG